MQPLRRRASDEGRARRGRTGLDGEILGVRRCKTKVIDECVQLHGGYGYMKEYPIAKHVDRRCPCPAHLWRYQRDHETPDRKDASRWPMYTPHAASKSRSNETGMRALMRSYDFAILLTAGGEPDLAATHIPAENWLTRTPALSTSWAMWRGANPVTAKTAIPGGHPVGRHPDRSCSQGPHAYRSRNRGRGIPRSCAMTAVRLAWNYIAVLCRATAKTALRPEKGRGPPNGQLSSQIAGFRAS